jgi:hypothetical protein
MKHYQQEYEPLEELLSFRETHRLDCQKSRVALETKKEVLYKQDFNSWGFKGSMDELMRKSDALRMDKEMAFKYMLTEESEKQKEK